MVLKHTQCFKLEKAGKARHFSSYFIFADSSHQFCQHFYLAKKGAAVGIFRSLKGTVSNCHCLQLL